VAKTWRPLGFIFPALALRAFFYSGGLRRRASAGFLGDHKGCPYKHLSTVKQSLAVPPITGMTFLDFILYIVDCIL
jgi:hypothetical protein